MRLRRPVEILVSSPLLVGAWTGPALAAPSTDVKRFGIEVGPEVFRVPRERAYSSPIRYTPR